MLGELSEDILERELFLLSHLLCTIRLEEHPVELLFLQPPLEELAIVAQEVEHADHLLVDELQVNSHFLSFLGGSVLFYPEDSDALREVLDHVLSLPLQLSQTVRESSDVERLPVDNPDADQETVDC